MQKRKKKKTNLHKNKSNSKVLYRLIDWSSTQKGTQNSTNGSKIKKKILENKYKIQVFIKNYKHISAFSKFRQLIMLQIHVLYLILFFTHYTKLSTSNGLEEEKKEFLSPKNWYVHEMDKFEYKGKYFSI